MAPRSRRCRVLQAVVATYAVAAVLALGYLFVVPARSEDKGPSPVTVASAPMLIALGDSFMSGEGADAYLPDTDIPDNRCHRATTAHPYLVAEALGMRLVAATCSGATTEDFDTAQHPSSPRSTYGGVPQYEALQEPRITPDGPVEPGNASVIIVGIGGNDADFGAIVRSCLDTDCRPQMRQRTALLDTEVQGRLAEAYLRIRELAPPGARVLVMTYPQPVIDTECVPGLTSAETREITGNFLPRLNDIIRFQASRADIGFEVVEAEKAIIGSRLCESPDPAMNGIVLQPGSGASAASGSIHPNEKGHRLLTTVVLAHLAQPAPGHVPPGPALPDDVPSVPPAGGPPGVPDGQPPGMPPGGPPGGPTTAPPNPDSLPPGAMVPVPASAPCSPGSVMELDNVRPLRSDEKSLTLRADPGTTACVCVGSQDWVTTTASGDGTLVVDVSRLNQARVSTIQVIREQDGILRSQVLTPPPDVLPGPTSWASRNVVWLGLAVAAPLVIALAVWWRTCRRAHP